MSMSINACICARHMKRSTFVKNTHHHIAGRGGGHWRA